MKIGLVSRWHVHANEYAGYVKNYPGAEVTAIWDESAERGKKWAEEFGCQYYGDFNRFLKSDIEAVVITSPTSLHPWLMTRAAKAGKHIFTEKVLSIKLTDARRIEAAVKENGVKFAISFPHLSRPSLLFAKDCVESGRIGKITYARVRNVHNGSSADWLPSYFYDESLCGGGAMIDLGAHPMYTLEWLLGKPLFVQSLFTDLTKRGVEDNAVSLIEFENGTTGVSETGFVADRTRYSLEISGTEGYLLITDGKVELADKSTGGKLVAVTDLPCCEKNPVDKWLDWCTGKTTAPQGLLIDDAVALTALMAASYKSAKNGDKTYVNF